MPIPQNKLNTQTNTLSQQTSLNAFLSLWSWIGARTKYRYDGILQKDVKQSQAYDMIGANTVKEVCEGFNGTILAYGQTGSGKTHTMIGAGFGEAKLDDANMWSPEGEVAGLMPRVSQALFQKSGDDSRNSKSLVQVTMDCDSFHSFQQ